MRMRKRTRITAYLLAAAVLAADFGGSSVGAVQAQEREQQEEIAENRWIQGRNVSGDDGANQAEEAENGLAALLREYELYGVVTNAASIPAYQEPSVEAPIVKNLSSGYQVRVLGAVVQEDGIWFQTAFAVHGVEYTGFIQEEYVISQDTRL